MDVLRPTTVGRKLAAVRLVHRWAARPITDAAIPLAVAALRGHARRHAHVAPRRVRAATGDVLWRLADACDVSTATGLRNRALILVGFDAALRAAELVALDHGHLTRTPDGIALALRRFKADQRGRGAVVSIAARPGSPWCPVAALKAWIEASGRSAGAVFVGARRGRAHPGAAVDLLSARVVAQTVRAAAVAAGLASKTHNDFSGHSLRHGLITTALDGGAPLDDVMHHARHSSPRSTLLHRKQHDAARRRPRVAIGPPGDVAPTPPAGLVRTSPSPAGVAPASTPPCADFPVRVSTSNDLSHEPIEPIPPMRATDRDLPPHAVPDLLAGGVPQGAATSYSALQER